MALIDYTAESACLMHLLRHGATGPNLQWPPIMQGRGIDPPLAEAGQLQAERASRALAQRPIRAVYASPLVRAVETALAVAAPHGLEVETHEELVEVEVGRWEGLGWDQIEREEPELYAAFIADPAKQGYPGGETLDAVFDRVAPCLERLMAAHPGEEIVVVAHSVVNRVYLGQLLGLTLAGGRKIAQENCAINLVRRRDGRVKPITINAVGHLLAN